MNLIKQIIERKLQKFDEEVMNNKEEFWDFFQTLNMTSCVISIKINKKKINELWLKSLNDDEKSIIRIKSLIYSLRKSIYFHLQQVEQEESKQDIKGDLYREGTVGIVSYEYT